MLLVPVASGEDDSDVEGVRLSGGQTTQIGLPELPPRTEQSCHNRLPCKQRAPQDIAPSHRGGLPDVLDRPCGFVLRTAHKGAHGIRVKEIEWNAMPCIQMYGMLAVRPISIRFGITSELHEVPLVGVVLLLTRNSHLQLPVQL
jgi:hypothetical protein